MDSERKDSDLEEDPELEALRMAALATLKSRSTKNSESEKPSAIQSTLDSAPYNRRDQVGGSLQKGQNSWRNSSNQNRRGRGRGNFPKVSPRSNLIVITPVTTDEKNSSDISTKPSLTLPQHRWCQPVNEDSSSPKTYSKRGPTRFNRHESDSESSDSDYDNGDQDSYSNETILQDENSTNCLQMTNDESNEGDSSRQRTLERRLSFQNTTLDDRQDPAKATYSNSTKDLSPSISNERDVAKDKDSASYSSYRRDSYKSETDAVNGEHRTLAEDSFSGNGTKSNKIENQTPEPPLANIDLRLALKMRMSQSSNGDSYKTEKFASEKHIDDGTAHSRSTSNRTSDNRLRNRSHSSDKGRNRFHSSSSSDSDRERSRSKRYTSRSPARKFNLESSSSPNRNGKRIWSRSPVKRRSLDRNSKHNDSRSSSRNRTETQSSTKSNKSSQSPSKCRKRSSSLSPNRRLKRNSRSPCRSRQNPPNDTDRNSKREKSRSPHKSRNGSPERKSKKDSSRSPSRKGPSPDRNHKNLDTVRRKSPQNPERKPRQKISWSPDRNRKPSRSPSRKNSYSRRNRSRSPIHGPKRVSASSSERSRAARRDKYSRHRSSRSSSSMSRSSKSPRSRSTSPCVRSISSVIKPVPSVVPPKVEIEENSRTNRHSSSDSTNSGKKGRDSEEKPKMISSLVKSSIVIGENRFNAPDGGKRLPVHMRLGTLPRNKLIRMTKDVEAAFVNSSSDDDVNDGKKQNLRVEVNKSDVSKRHVEKSPLKKTSVADSKSWKKKAYR